MKSTTALMILAILATAGAGTAAPDKKPKAKNDSPPQKQEKVPEQKSNRPKSEAVPLTEKIAWLGIATSPVNPALREHLELPRGFGVQVEFVVEDSPAADAGLTDRDILTLLDDQHLTSPEHLAILVRSKKKGDDITLTVVRKGKKETIDVTLGEKEVPIQPEWPHSYGFHGQPMSPDTNHFNLPGQPPSLGGDRENWEENLRDYQDRVRKWIDRGTRQWFEPRHPDAQPSPGPGAGSNPVLPLPGKSDAHPVKPEPDPIARPAQNQGEKPPALSVRPGFPIQVFSGSGLIRIDNGEGEVSIQSKDGKHSIKIVNSAGETVFEGKYDPEEGTEKLPEEAQKQLERMKLDDLKLLGVPDSNETDSKTEIKIDIKSNAQTERGKGGLL